MNRSMNPSRLLALRAVGALALALVATGAWAQDTTATSVRHGEPSIATAVKNATIVYVEGNNLVLKLENGKVEHLIVPFDEKFTIDGKQLTVTELKAGTRLTQTITTTTTPRYINSVRTIKGKVWHVNAPGAVIVSLPDGSNQLYKVPSHARFKIDGNEKTVFDLKKGMKLEATIITDSSESVVASNKETSGTAPVLAMPAMAGVLLVKPAPAPSVAETVASVEELPTVLPKTATSLPLAGLLGALSLAASAGLAFARRKVTLQRD